MRKRNCSNLTLHSITVIYETPWHCAGRLSLEGNAYSADVNGKVCIRSCPCARAKRGDGGVQQVRVWRGAIPDVLPVLPGVRRGSWRAGAAAGEHFRLGSGV